MIIRDPPLQRRIVRYRHFISIGMKNVTSFFPESASSTLPSPPFLFPYLLSLVFCFLRRSDSRTLPCFSKQDYLSSLAYRDFIFGILVKTFRWVYPSLYEGVSVRPLVGWSVTCFFKCRKWTIFRWVHPSLYEDVSVRPSVGRSVRPSVRRMDGWSVTCFFLMPKMDNFH